MAKLKLSKTTLANLLEAAGGSKDEVEGLRRASKQDIDNAVKEVFGTGTIGKIAGFAAGKFIDHGDEKGKKGKSPSKQDNKNSPTKEGAPANAGISEDVLPFLNVIAKNSIVLPGMARDMNVLRQNIAKLVNLKGKESKVKAEGKADKFFQTEDLREAKLEEERKKNTPTKDGKDKKEPKEEKKEGGGLLSGLMDMLNPMNLLKGLFAGIVGAFGALFSGGSIFAILSKIFVPAMIIGGLINGIMDAINTFKETGSITDALISGLGGFLQFITFGLFNENDLRKGMDTALKYINPLLLSVTEFFDNIVSFFKNVGIPAIPFSKFTTITFPDFIRKSVKLLGGSLPESYTLINDTKPYYPFKKDTTSTATESYTSGATTALKENQAKLDSGEGVFYDKERKAKEEQKEKDKAASTSPEAAKSLAEKVGTSPSKEDPYSSKNAEKDQKSAVGFLKTKLGITVDPNSSTGFIDDKTGEQLSEEAVRQEVAAVGGDPTKILQNARGQKTTTPISTPTASSAAAAASIGGGSISGGGGGGGGGGMSGGSAVSPSPSSESTPSVSGAALTSASSEVAEGQRMDSAADAGVTIDAPTTNNQAGAKGKEPENTASVYNTSFINNYMTA
jgi:hypothetical protein